MAEVVGKIVKIKLSTLLNGSAGPNSLDIGSITLKDANGWNWLYYLWVSRGNEPALYRVLQTQRLALAREAAFRDLTVHIWHQSDSSVIDHIQVDIA